RTSPQAVQSGVVARRLHLPHRFPPLPSLWGRFWVRPQVVQRGSWMVSKPLARSSFIKRYAVGDASERPEVNRSGLAANSRANWPRACRPPALIAAEMIRESGSSGSSFWQARTISARTLLGSRGGGLIGSGDPVAGDVSGRVPAASCQ